MPTYTYRCQKCGHEFERFQSMSDEPVKRCEKCKGKVHRVFHPVGIVLKGSGFYKTDNRSSSKKSSGGGESKSSESSESSSESSSASDSKSETKSEKKTDTKSDSKSSTKPSSKSP
jgi:putative FmdB family regulatory protein